MGIKTEMDDLFDELENETQPTTKPKQTKVTQPPVNVLSNSLEDLMGDEELEEAEPPLFEEQPQEIQIPQISEEQYIIHKLGEKIKFDPNRPTPQVIEIPDMNKNYNIALNLGEFNCIITNSKDGRSKIVELKALYGTIFGVEALTNLPDEVLSINNQLRLKAKELQQVQKPIQKRSPGRPPANKERVPQQVGRVLTNPSQENIGKFPEMATPSINNESTEVDSTIEATLVQLYRAIKRDIISTILEKKF